MQKLGYESSKTQVHQASVFLCFPVSRLPSFPLIHIIWAPDPLLSRRMKSFVSLLGNASYCEETLEVSLLTKFCFCPQWKEALPSFNTLWICSVLTALLFFVLMLLTFSIPCLLHLRFLFYYLFSSIFVSKKIYHLLQRQIKFFTFEIQYFSCPNTWRKKYSSQTNI